MIEKMKFLSITGPKSDFDRVVSVYLSKYEIHLENALSELRSVHDLKPFIEVNPYKEAFLKAEELSEKLDRKVSLSQNSLTPKAAAELVTSIALDLSVLEEKKTALKEEQNHLRDLLAKIQPFIHLDYEINKILDFKFTKFRFGRISHEYFTRFSKYVYDNLTTLFFECDSDAEYIWGVYFVPAAYSVKIDAIYSSLHFERIYLPAEYEGTPEEAYKIISAKLDTITNEIKETSSLEKEKLINRSEDILSAYETLSIFSKNFDVRKLAACTKSSTDSDLFYFILCGWMTKDNAVSFLSEIEDDPNVYCLSEDTHEDLLTKPPTKLKNIPLFKPFEMFIKMYGLPAYNELDPTSFVAITYSLLFGIMFGDVGQGLCLVIGGAFIYKFKKLNLAAIISLAGVFSTLMGFLYGSVFGFEDLIPHLWLKPMDNVMTILLTAVGFGVILILLSMILNIINGIRSKDTEKIFFDTNGIAGLVFYGAAITCVLLIASGKPLPAVLLLVLFFGIPLILIFFREPLAHLVEKKTKIFPDNKAMFFIEAFFELFEILLCYVTNSISFLRVGAFALSHGAMMGVVMLLAHAESAAPNIIILILGNAFVAGMEALIAGIQVLRLEYYEMFSRFYKGTGKVFKPYKNK
ncbi:V-type ATPase 116kDa subunit family protein [Anaerocolumna sp. AGMB13025]|uniref:V-type ATP synthase subunit I n=1 Tax=Anaerocolumna sp. AGMB13025 TaxID=3039116 RepID=UPI00241FCDD0|nr:V-type ATPase 116kDa subunit family protein [Anaerocolumna sp. AGMB13025]WFR57485.1 V-type ATPase 116kDa subunit family protein [Anaerocolumna sp. AGMB13025]